MFLYSYISVKYLQHRRIRKQVGLVQFSYLDAAVGAKVEEDVEAAVQWVLLAGAVQRVLLAGANMELSRHSDDKGEDGVEADEDESDSDNGGFAQHFVSLPLAMLYSLLPRRMNTVPETTAGKKAEN